MSSLRIKFSILFGIALLFIIGLWYQTNKIIVEKQIDRARNETMLFAQSILPNYTAGNIGAVKLAVKKSGYTLLVGMPQNYQVIGSKKDDMLGLKIFRTSDQIGFSVKYFGDRFVVAKKNESNFWEENHLRIFFLPIILILVIFYITSLALLNPIKKLNQAIKKFAKGEGKIIQTRRKDEIGDIINAFNLMAGKVSKMLKSRELILRNIGHELKTPLTKMKLILALDENKSEKFKQLERYVANMQKISDNMLEFERVNSGNIIIANEEFLSETLIFEALSIFLDEENRIDVNFGENFIITGDLRLLSVAVKNLVENALKYAQDGKIYIECIQNKIIVKNKGEPLGQDIGYYLEPFFRDNAHSTVSGHGLGLSIVKEILTLHHCQLEYNYFEGEHIFSICF